MSKERELIELARAIRLIFAVAFIGALLALLLTAFLPQRHTGLLTFGINAKEAQPTPEFRFEGFYTTETAGRLVESLLAVLKEEGYASVEQRSGERQVKIRGKRLGVQTGSFSVTAKTAEEAGKVTDAVLEVAKERVAKLAPPEQPFEFVVIEKRLGQTRRLFGRNIALGFVAGAFAGLAFLFLRALFRADLAER